jgi:hypothetical protein
VVDPEALEETRELIRMAQAIRRSVWYEHQRHVVPAHKQHPTLLLALSLVDKLAIYSAGGSAPGSDSGDR